MFKAESVVKGSCSSMFIGGQLLLRVCLSTFPPEWYYANDDEDGWNEVLADDVPMFERLYVMREQ